MKTFLRMYGMFIYIPILFCSLFSSVTRGQDISTGPVRFQQQTSQFSNNDESQPIWLNNGTLMMIYTSHDSIYCSRSLNSQLTSWDKPSLITSFNRSSQALSIVLSATVTVTNRVILIYSLANKSNLSSEALRITYSDDTGRTWSESKNVYSSMNITFPSIAQSLDGKLWISGRGNYFFISTDNGLTWTPDKRDFTSNCLIALNDNSLISFSESSQNNLTSIQYRKSTDNGKTWSSPVSLSNSQLSEERPRAIVSSDGTIWLTYQVKKSTSFNDIYQYDIYYKKSTDKGSSWSQALQLTKYAGSDLDCNISAAQSKAIISFTSDRYFESPFWTYMKLNFKQIWFAIPDSTKDDNSAPAVLYASSHSAPSTDGSIPLSFKAYTGSNLGISSVTLSYKTHSQAAERTIELYDDGKHNDNQANDNIWGGSLPEIIKAEQLSYSFKITDKSNKVSSYYGGTVDQPAVDLKWMSIGSLQDWYSPMGCEPEETMIHPILKKVDQQTGWQWPADHDLMDCQAWKGLWIGAKNFTDETSGHFPYKVVHVGPRVSGIGEFFPTKFYIKSKYPKPLVTVNGKPSYSPNDAVVDSVDPTMLADREIVNVVSTQLGLTMTRRIFQFSHPYHDNYIVTEYTFTNTGDTDGDPTTIELPNNTLEGVQMFWQYKMAPSFYSRYVIGNSSGWGVNTTIDTRGDGVKPDPAGQSFRTQYAWHGLYTDFATCNNIGGPITTVATNVAKGDTVWRLAAFQFVGTLTLHADKSS
ncbi:MAG: sialidase family protein, partial [Bacteroidota bacterium]|nr:sialidase family protein [Bacteroidota bacterium]